MAAIMVNNSRAVALKILTKLFTKKNHLSALFLEFKADAYAKKLCFEICRNYFSIENILFKAINNNPVNNIKLILFIGIYELVFLKKPPHATVNELVKISPRTHKNFVNAVLRNLKYEETVENFNHPEWLIARIMHDWPQYWQNILHANNQHPPLTLRVNKQQYDCNAYLNLLHKNNIAAQATQGSPVGIIIDHNVDLITLPAFEQGACSVQDVAAQLVINCLDLKPNLRILDACAAPGGKASHILETQPSTILFAVEQDVKRVEKLKDNFTRLNLNAKIFCADATEPKEWWDHQAYDRILIDAPCSATGVIRRHPDIKILRTSQEIKNLIKTQRKLLTNLWPLLKKNGLMIYTTCSILQAENDLQILDFVKNHNANLIHENDILDKFAIKTKAGWQLLPGNSINADGFFYSIIKCTD